MSDADVYHRIELREGSGEPPVLDLLPGESLGPIDVGTAGHWRVTAAGVTDSHAYLFFDGEQLFLQSADPSMPVIANGLPLPSRWVAVEPPCEIAIGEALLWFDASGEDIDVDAGWDAPSPAAGYVPPRPGGYAGPSPPGYAPPSAPSSPGYATPPSAPSGPGYGPSSQPYGSGGYPAPNASSPGSGGYSSPGQAYDDEIVDEDSEPDPFGDATNVVPVEEFMARTSATRRAALAQLLNLPPSGSDAGAPAPSAPQRPVPPPSHPGSSPGHGLLDLPDPSASGRGHDMPPPSAPSATVALPDASGPGLPDLPPISRSQPGLTPDQGDQVDHLQQLPSHDDPASQTAKTNAAPKPSLWGGMSFPQKATAILFLPMVLSVIVLFTDVVPVPKPHPGSAATTRPTASPSSVSAGPSPSIDEPLDEPKVEVEEPAGSATETPEGDSSAKAIDSAAPEGSASADEPDEPDEPAEEIEDVPKGEKTMQRQAVDALAQGNYQEAAELYEALAKRYPKNEAYAAAAAITRAKVEAKK